MYTAYPRKEETAAAVPSSSFLTCMHHARGIPTLFSHQPLDFSISLFHLPSIFLSYLSPKFPQFCHG
jgi:hypothetical protein